MTSAHNPLQTYTLDEVGALMHCSRQQVTTWMDAGILKGIKTGKGTVITTITLTRFQETYEGQDVSNLVRTMDAKNKKKNKKESGERK